MLFYINIVVAVFLGIGVLWNFLKIIRRYRHIRNLEEDFDFMYLKNKNLGCDFCMNSAWYALRSRSLFELEDEIIPDRRIVFCCPLCYDVAKRSVKSFVEMVPSKEDRELLKEVKLLYDEMN